METPAIPLGLVMLRELPPTLSSKRCILSDNANILCLSVLQFAYALACASD